MSRLKEEYYELKRLIEDLYCRQICLYKEMIADDALIEQNKNEYAELKKQIEDLYNKQIDIYKAMIAEPITSKHI